MYQRDKSIRKQSKLASGVHSSPEKASVGFAGACWQMNTHFAKIDQETRKIE